MLLIIKILLQPCQFHLGINLSLSDFSILLFVGLLQDLMLVVLIEIVILLASFDRLRCLVVAVPSVAAEFIVLFVSLGQIPAFPRLAFLDEPILVG